MGVPGVKCASIQSAPAISTAYQQSYHKQHSAKACCQPHGFARDGGLPESDEGSGRFLPLRCHGCHGPTTWTLGPGYGYWHGVLYEVYVAPGSYPCNGNHAYKAHLMVTNDPAYINQLHPSPVDDLLHIDVLVPKLQCILAISSP